jgi:putative nucleotidyltransferase with HDIG domain
LPRLILLRIMADTNLYENIDLAQLKVGMFIRLDVHWMSHPFVTSSFKIKDSNQINIIRGLGLKTIQYDPARSDVKAGSRNHAVTPAVSPSPALNEAQLAAMAAKKARIERMAKQMKALAECEKKFVRAADSLKVINTNLFSRPQESIEATNQLVDQMVESIMIDEDMALQMMGSKMGGQEIYHHSLNVAVLSMILGREMKCTMQEMKSIGVGAVFHDIGKMEIPEKILRKTDTLTNAERSYLEQHPVKGETIAKNMKMAPEIMDMIRHHHEAVNGAGYPDALKGPNIQKLTKIVMIANAFDNYCNMPNPSDSLTPYEALSRMYAKDRNRYDGTALPIFIRAMGVYPPGTVVRLSNEIIGLVISVNTSKPLRPNILIYDPDVPKNEAIVLDLEQETDINIVKTLRPGQLPREVLAYLNPRKRVTYFFDEAPSEGAKGIR